MNSKNQRNSFNEQMRDLVKNKIVIAIAGIIFGFILIIHAAAAVDALVRILGWILLVSAAAYLAKYFAQKEERETSLMVLGIILAVTGIFFVIRPDAIVNLFPLIMGIDLIIAGISDLVNAVSLDKAGVQGAKAFIVMSAVVTILGIIVLLHPGAVADMIVTVMGISLLINGTLDLIMLAANKAD